MTKTAKRDNGYWLHRLDKDGHDDLLIQIDAGEITVYRATQLAGYRARATSSPVAKLSHHWTRASVEERRRFVRQHLSQINRFFLEVREEITELKAQKSAESDKV